MRELAFNFDGEPIDVPTSAIAWQVRQPASQGTPELTGTADRLPLFLPIDAGIEDLCRAVGSDGRYQLVPVDENHRPIEGAACASVWLRSRRVMDASTVAMAGLSIQQVLAMAKTNVDVARLLLAQAAVFVEAAGTLLGTVQDTDLVIEAIRVLIK
jgi:hypothetical protein